MMTIHLKKLLFDARHGVHAEEKLIGGKFQVDLSIVYHPTNLPLHHLDETINYVDVYNLVKNKMEKPTLLLETIATELSAEIFEQFKLAESLEISIIKLHPPITAIQGSVGVTFNAKRNH